MTESATLKAELREMRYAGVKADRGGVRRRLDLRGTTERARGLVELRYEVQAR